MTLLRVTRLIAGGPRVGDGIQQQADRRQIADDGDVAVGACNCECGWIGQQSA
jgi:hypothetical protein